MNAPLPAAAALPVMAPIAIQLLAPSATNVQALRRRRFNKDTLAELAANIKNLGIQQPILARRLAKPAGEATLEIVAGERRWLAAKIAGLATVPVIVREIPDGDVVELQLTENLQRENPHELEEAEGYDELRKLKKLNAEQIGALMGKSRSHVFARMKLLELCPEAREACYAGKISASVAHLLARIGHHDTQRRALKDLTDERGPYKDHDGPMTYREAQDHIAEYYMVELKKTPFKLDDAQLVPKAGPCTTCPKRTGNQRDLFSDVKNPNVCTDPKCFDDKRQAVFAVARKALEAKGQKVIAGDQAKKLLPHWENGSEYVAGGYHKLNERDYGKGGGRTYKEILGKDFQPTLVQHPFSGDLVEVVSTSVVATALSKGKAAARKAQDDDRGPRAAAKKPSGPDVDDVLTERLAQLVFQKVPEKFSRALLLTVAKIFVPMVRGGYPGDGLALVAKQYGWTKKDFGEAWSRRLPTKAEGFDERKLCQLLVMVAFADHEYRYQGRQRLLTHFGINEQKVREQIIEERKAARRKAPSVDAAAKGVGPNVGYNVPLQPDAALAAIVGPRPLHRIEITKRVWSYIKRNGLQDKTNKRMVNADAKMQAVFGGKKQASMFEMVTMLNKHLSVATGSTPTKTALRKAKKK